MAEWCETVNVWGKMESLRGKGIGDEDIPEKIAEAQRFLTSKFLGCYSVSIVTGWDSSTPDTVKDFCAIIAALYAKQSFIDDYKITEVEKRTLKLIDDIVQGRAEMLDASDAQIARAVNRVKFNKTNKNRDFSMGNTGDDTIGDGTLDDFGQNANYAEGNED